LWILS
jgi:hypothetical protein